MLTTSRKNTAWVIRKYRLCYTFWNFSSSGLEFKYPFCLCLALYIPLDQSSSKFCSRSTFRRCSLLRSQRSDHLNCCHLSTTARTHHHPFIKPSSFLSSLVMARSHTSRLGVRSRNPQTRDVGKKDISKDSLSMPQMSSRRVSLKSMFCQVKQHKKHKNLCRMESVQDNVRIVPFIPSETWTLAIQGGTRRTTQA